MVAAADPGRSGRKPRVAVVFGGRSSEHGVSCLTASQVIAAIDRDRYDVVPVGISRDGRWVLESCDAGRYAISGGELPTVDPSRAGVALAQSHGTRELMVQDQGDIPRTLGEVDVVFPLLHGPWGEDGTLQGLLEMSGVRYVGAGVLASAVGMDKHMMKIVLAAAGLPMVPYVVVARREWERDKPAVRESVASLGWPVFVKPARAGSSLGVTRVDGPQDLDAAIETARALDPKVIVEAAAADARELECGVLEAVDGSSPEASVVGEIRVDTSRGHRFYDFEAKYLDGGGELDVPANVDGATAEQVRSWAVRAFQAIGCEGLARVDFFLLRDGRLLVNEINTMPGFTPTSMYPRLWDAAGLDYRALVDRLITLAADRPVGLR
ncbi:MAG: D-alanine--D-alanine ligase family protein [Nocardioidaceae bacterium]